MLQLQHPAVRRNPPADAAYDVGKTIQIGLPKHLTKDPFCAKHLCEYVQATPKY